MQTPSSTSARPRRRWFQWKLRTMLVLVTLAAIVMAFRLTYEKLVGERNAIQRLKELGANISREFEEPTWIQRLAGLNKVEHGVAVGFPSPLSGTAPAPPPQASNLAGADEGDEVCRLLARLPRLRGISLRGEPIDDRHLKYFRELENLEYLYVRGSHVTVGGIEGFADAAADFDIDVACAERLYRATLAAVEVGTCLIQDAVMRFETAADWKLACAEFQGEAAEAAAYDQLARWLEQLAARARSKGSQEVFMATPQQQALIGCALADARIKAALARGDKPAAVLAAQAGLDQANKLVAKDWQRSLETAETATTDDWFGCWSPLLLILALERATAMEVAHAELTDDHDASVAALRRYEVDLGLLGDFLQKLDEAGTRLIPIHWMLAAQVWRADAGARLARIDGQESREIQLLRGSARDRVTMCHALIESYANGTETVDAVILGWQKLTAMDIALAQALGDAEAEREARRAYRAFVAHHLVMALSPRSIEEIIRPPLAFLRCLHAREELRHRGREFYEDDTEVFWPDQRKQARIKADWEPVLGGLYDRLP